MTAQAESHYDVLGVSATAEDTVIRGAYLALLRKHHPDIACPEGEKRTGLINHAYSVLSDPAERRAYDRGRSEADEDEQAGYRPAAAQPSESYGYVYEQAPTQHPGQYQPDHAPKPDLAPIHWTRGRERLAFVATLVSAVLLTGTCIFLLARFGDPLAAGPWGHWLPVFVGLALVVAVKRRVRWQFLALFLVPTVGFLAGLAGWWGFEAVYSSIGLLPSVGLAVLLPAALGVRFATPWWWRLFRNRSAG